MNEKLHFPAAGILMSRHHFFILILLFILTLAACNKSPVLDTQPGTEETTTESTPPDSGPEVPEPQAPDDPEAPGDPGAPDDPEPLEPDDNLEPPPGTPEPTASPLTFDFDKRTDAHEKGVWTTAANWPLIAIHMALLPNGDVFSFGSGQYGDSNEAFIYDVWTPDLGLSQEAHTTLDKQSPTDIFCSGQTLLSDGQLLIIGGNVGGDANRGSTDVNLFNPLVNSMTKSPLQLTKGRWYPTLTTLANGDVVMQAGWDYSFQAVTTPEIWRQDGSWKILTGATDINAFGNANIWYPWSFLTNQGNIFIAGPDNDMYLLEPTGEGKVSTLAKRDAKVRGYGNAVMFAPDKILAIGGGEPPTESTYLINISNETNPVVTQASDMSIARRHHNSTLLPTGDVLVTGGSYGAGFNDESKPIFKAEIWNSDSDTWTDLASANVVRTYHSTALLLANGAIISAGGGKCGCIYDNYNAEVFLPPYLFKKDGSGDLAPRPRIESAPAELSYGQRFTLELSNTDIRDIMQVSLIRTGSTTHAWNHDQRFMNLDFKAETWKSLNVESPQKAAYAPPGFYLLSVVDKNGVPSASKIIQLN